MSRLPWSPAEDERLRKLALSGLSLQEIAAHMERNPASIRSRTRTLNVAVARGQNGMVRFHKTSDRRVDLGAKK